MEELRFCTAAVFRLITNTVDYCSDLSPTSALQFNNILPPLSCWGDTAILTA